jgi:hypothetical protein
VVVVKDEDDVVGMRREVVEQRPQSELSLRLRRLEDRERRGADVRSGGLQRGDDVGPERRGIVVLRFEGQPGGGP